MPHPFGNTQTPDGRFHVRQLEANPVWEPAFRQDLGHKPLALGDKAGNSGAVLAQIFRCRLAEVEVFIFRDTKQFDSFEPSDEGFNERVTPGEELSRVLVNDSADNLPMRGFQHFRHGHTMPQGFQWCQSTTNRPALNRPTCVRNFSWRLLLLSHTQLFELRRNVGAVGLRADLRVDMENFPVFADVKCPAFGEVPLIVDHAVGSAHVLASVGQDRIIGAEGFGERLDSFFAVDRIATGGEISHIELADFCAALTERLALGRSATGKDFGKPGEHDGSLPFEVRKLVRLAVAAGEIEVRGVVAHFQGFTRPGCGSAAAQPGRHADRDAHEAEGFHRLK